LSTPGRIVVREPGALVEAAADWIAAAIEDAVRERGRCAVAVAGGSTPRPVYERLAREPYRSRLPWQAVDLFFGDERAVPPDDPASNYRMVSLALLERLPTGPGRVHRMEGERADADAAARDYERLLPETLDLLLLGTGPDGHTASLFPGSPALDEQQRRVVAVTGTKPPPRRLTVTPPVIRSARRIAVLAIGAEKAAVVARALQGPLLPYDLPVQLALRGVWFLDREAAALLRTTAP
jgi:6-phosphogluconolactonase